MNGGMTDTLISGRAILEEEKGKTPQHIKPTRKGWLFYCRCIYCRRIVSADFSVALSGPQ
jgi:hypothetical protein